MKNIIFILLILISLKSIGQTTYTVNIILDKDSLEQGELGFATYEVLGTNSNLTFSWEYESNYQLSNDQFGFVSTQISFADTLFYSFSDVGLHEIKLRVHWSYYF